MAKTKLDWSFLPPDLAYISEPATKWGITSDYDEQQRMLQKMSARDRRFLERLYESVNCDRDRLHAAIDARLDEHRKDEAALRAYWFIAFMTENFEPEPTEQAEIVSPEHVSRLAQALKNLPAGWRRRAWREQAKLAAFTVLRHDEAGGTSLGFEQSVEVITVLENGHIAMLEVPLALLPYAYSSQMIEAAVETYRSPIQSILGKAEDGPGGSMWRLRDGQITLELEDDGDGHGLALSFVVG